jgi:hypothetical protein
MSNIDKQALLLRMRNYLETALKSGVKLLHLSIDELEGLLDELGNKEEQRANWFQMAQKLGDDLDAAEKRIAELNRANSMLVAKIEPMGRRIAELEAQTEPTKGEVLVTVTGFTGCGKSAIAGEIEIAMKAIGVPVQWTNGDAEKRMTGADWLTAIEMYKPTVRIVEVNVPRAAGISIKGSE